MPNFNQTFDTGRGQLVHKAKLTRSPITHTICTECVCSTMQNWVGEIRHSGEMLIFKFVRKLKLMFNHLEDLRNCRCLISFLALRLKRLLIEVCYRFLTNRPAVLASKHNRYKWSCRGLCACSVSGTDI